MFSVHVHWPSQRLPAEKWTKPRAACERLPFSQSVGQKTGEKDRRLTIAFWGSALLVAGGGAARYILDGVGLPLMYQTAFVLGAVFVAFFAVLVAARIGDRLSGCGAEGAWLLGICKRKVIDDIRRRNRPDTAAGGDFGSDPTEAVFDEKGNWRFDPSVVKGRPESALLRAEFWQAFRACLKRLSQRQADAFTLRELEELGSEEICKNLQISTSNLWVLLHRARLVLTQCMKSKLEI